MKTPIILIDHYDSFTFNLRDLLSVFFEVHLVEHDKCDELRPSIPVVLSPGPKTPSEALLSQKIVKNCWGSIPILGVCLGHQILGHVFGAEVTHSVDPKHGQTKNLNIIRPDDPLFTGIPQGNPVASYHSLAVKNTPKGWDVIATCSRGEIQAMRLQRSAYVYGIQFHPESFMTQNGKRIVENWSSLVDRWMMEKMTTACHVTDVQSFCYS